MQAHDAQRTALDEAEERFRILSELSSDFVYVFEIRPDGSLKNYWLAEAFERVFGTTFEAMAGRGWRHWVLPEDQALARERVHGLLSGRSFEGEFRVRDERGQIRHIHDRARPVLDDEGRVRRVYGAATDVTEARRTHARLRQSEQTYRRMLEASPLPILVRAEEAIVFANPAAARALAAEEPSALVGLPIWRLVPESERATVAERFRALSERGGRVEARQGRLRRLDGVEIEVQEVGNSVDFRGRRAAEIVFHDVTETNRALRQRRALEARHQRAQKLESLGSLAAGIAHDFNNILIGLMGHADLALELLDTPPAGSGTGVRDHLDEIGKAAQHAADLVQQLLDFAGEPRLASTRLDLADLVAEMRELLPLSIQKRARIRYTLPAGLPPIEADATQVKQILMNLVMNAADACAAAGSSEIRVEVGSESGPATYSESFLAQESARPRATSVGAEPGATTTPGDGARGATGDGGKSRDEADRTKDDGPERVYVAVTDDGVGMDQATQQRLFEPFYTTKSTGRGLGMATVLGIVHGHGGALDVDSAPGRGTTIRIIFPAARPTAC